LIHPLLPPGRAFDQPARLDLERGGIQRAHFRRYPIDLRQASVEVLQVGNHDLVPDIQPLQILDHVLVGDREFTREVGFHVQVLERGLDRLRHSGDIGNGRGRRNGEAIGIAHADPRDTGAQRLPVEPRRGVGLDIAATLFRQKPERFVRQDAAIPERTVERGVAAAFLGEVGRGPVGAIGNRLHRLIGELDRFGRRVRNPQGVQAILERHDSQSDRPMLEVRVAGLPDRVVIKIDDVVQHTHRGADGAPQLVEIHTAILAVEVRQHVDRAQVAHGDFVRAGVQRDLGAQVGAMHDADVLLRRAQVARVLERDPGVTRLEQHGQHAPPQLDRRNTLEQRELAACSFGLVRQVSLLELAPVLLVQVGHIGR
jgi:hypothetical protein